MLRQYVRIWLSMAVVAAVLNVAGMSALAQAELVTFSFKGALSQIDAPLTSTWSPGQAFSGTYTFDSNEQNHGALQALVSTCERLGTSMRPSARRK